MTDYTDHPDSLFDTGAPILGSTGLETRDNLIATGEGASGSPSFVPNYGKNVTAGAVGSHVFANYNGGSGVALGDTVAASELDSVIAYDTSGVSLSGTWRCLGESVDAVNPNRNSVTLWVRIS